ncbi:peroxiredoxin family protein [Halomarina halobia]|uniref:Peroxiredoxin family protein n=1 Tax=Halomarina halobia TaxID=3033386 RepID=A0ABD6AEJ6_9EURY|nr:peroxiredoxin family protein [Halomarina sp. PSR21]
MSLVGQQAPDFELESTSGKTVTLSDTLSNGPTVIVFFRGYWCSYCQEHLRTFSHLNYDLWRHLNVDILPISSSTVPDLVEMRDRFELTLQLLSDEDLEVTRQYTDTEDNSKHGEIPVPSTVIVDTDGIVRYQQIGDDPADRTSANLVRHILKNDFEHPYPEKYY